MCGNNRAKFENIGLIFWVGHLKKGGSPCQWNTVNDTKAFENTAIKKIKKMVGVKASHFNLANN